MPFSTGMALKISAEVIAEAATSGITSGTTEGYAETSVAAAVELTMTVAAMGEEWEEVVVKALLDGWVVVDE